MAKEGKMTTYQSAPPPVYETERCCECTCCGLLCSCSQLTIDIQKIKKEPSVLIRAIAYYLIILGVIGITLTCLDPVPNLMYTFPLSTVDTAQHQWDCIHFQAYGLAIGVLFILYGLVLNKIAQQRDSDVAIVSFIGVCFIICLLFVVFSTFHARKNPVDDPNMSKNYAVTTEGYPINSVSCNTYMYNYHKMGLFGSWIYTIGIFGPLAIALSVVIVYYLIGIVFYLFSCKSVCPKYNQYVENEMC